MLFLVCEYLYSNKADIIVIALIGHSTGVSFEKCKYSTEWVFWDNIALKYGLCYKKLITIEYIIKIHLKNMAQILDEPTL